MRRSFLATALLLASGLTLSLRAGDPDRDFSGKWVLDPASSDIRSLGQVESSLTVSQSAAAMLCSTGPAGWSYALDGSETRKHIGEESWNSVTKWEGAALLVNTLVSGPRDYTVMDRWVLSRDRSTLTITRQIVRARGEVEGRMVFRREGALIEAARPAVREAAPVPALATTPRPSEPGADMPQPVLAKRPEPGVPPDVTVPRGTRVLLALVNEVSTKSAKEGDRVRSEEHTSELQSPM